MRFESLASRLLYPGPMATANQTLDTQSNLLLRFLSRPVVGRLLFLTAAISATLALGLSAAIHFGLLPKAGSTRSIESEEQNNSNETSSALNSIVVESGYDREGILNDFESRIDDQFSVPEGLRDRVGFWFDIYSQYDSNKRVIHHVRYPWIIYKVVDVEPIINSKTPKWRWMRNEKADKHVKSEMNKIRAALRSVSRKKSLNKLNHYEQLVVDALKKLDGPVKRLAARALNEVRVQTGQRDFFIEGLSISSRYLGTMEEIFREHKLPIELTRLPFVESSFNKHATSKVGATGIWQFMGNTGRKFMIVNDTIDERRSPFKASEAAARLLKENHMILYRQWPLAITAWNHGPSGVRKAVRAVGSRDISQVVSKYRSKTFDFASSNFYAEFLAALHAVQYQDKIYGEFEKEPALVVEVVKISRRIRVSEVIRASGLSVEKFLMINPELKIAAKRNIKLPTGFRLHVPRQVRPDIERLLAMRSAKPLPKRSS